jgi:hypothetical protein
MRLVMEIHVLLSEPPQLTLSAGSRSVRVVGAEAIEEFFEQVEASRQQWEVYCLQRDIEERNFD